MNPIVLSKSGPDLIYQQISTWILQQVNTEVWPEHYQLPAEVDLADQLGVSRGTVRKAIADLTSKGVLVSIHGRGTFVKSKTLEQPLADTLIAFSEDLIEKGIAFETRVIEQKLITPSEHVASLLAVENQVVFYLKRVRSIGGKPIVVLENYVATGLCPGIEMVDFSQERLFQVLENRFQIIIDWGWRTFQARSAPPEVAELLHGSVPEPIMYMEQLAHTKDGKPLEYSNIWFKGDKFRLVAQVKREALDSTRKSALTLVTP